MNNGGPAFPIVVEGGDMSGLHADRWDGMTLRDWFAGQAVSAWLSQCQTMPTPDHLKMAATTSYDLADAMLAARGEG